MRPLVLAAAGLLAIGLFVVNAVSQSSSYSVGEYQRDMRALIDTDATRPAGDVSLWPRVADITRRLARNVGVKAANDALDRAYSSASTRKLYSKVWAALPGSTIQGLQEHIYRGAYDIYGPKTEYPQIRRDLLAVVSAFPNDPFIEFAYYALGDFERADAVRPESPIKDVINHAIGFNIVGELVGTAYARAVNAGAKSNEYYNLDTDHRLLFLNRNARVFGNRPLASIFPDFAARAAVAKQRFDRVIEMPKSPCADDAAYFAAWLAYQQGNYDEALDYLRKSMSIGNGDYRYWGAVKEAIRVLERRPAEQQFTLLRSDAVLAKQSPIWYVAARAAYRNFDYDLSRQISQAAMSKFDIAVDGLPVTTDSERIESALNRHTNIRKDWQLSLHMSEMAYLRAASREIEGYVASLGSAARTSPDQMTARAKTIIVKYSKMLDTGGGTARVLGGSVALHKDLRQAVHLIDVTLASLPAEQKFTALREWLHYRKVRILAVFAPASVGSAIEAMEREYPTSKLMNNALAEQIFAESYVRGDMIAAKAVFDKLRSQFPNGNAVDNAYSWMSIGYRCAGQVAAAQAIERELIQRFPYTRHATYALERLAGASAPNGNSETCVYRREDAQPDNVVVASASATAAAAMPTPAAAVDARPAAGPRQYRTFENADVLGHDLDIIRSATLETCQTSCNGNAACVAFSYDKWNRVCFLKDSAPELAVDARSVTAVSIKLPAPAMSNERIVIQRFRNRAFPGQGDARATVSSFNQCEAQCNQSSSCIAFTFQKSSLECRMFRTTLEYSPNRDTDSGSKVSGK